MARNVGSVDDAIEQLTSAVALIVEQRHSLTARQCVALIAQCKHLIDHTARRAAVVLSQPAWVRWDSAMGLRERVLASLEELRSSLATHSRSVSTIPPARECQ